MGCNEKESIYDVNCICSSSISVAQLVASMSGVVLGRFAEVVGSNLARGKYLQHLSAHLIY